MFIVFRLKTWLGKFKFNEQSHCSHALGLLVPKLLDPALGSQALGSQALLGNQKSSKLQLALYGKLELSRTHSQAELGNDKKMHRTKEDIVI
jgi:hypothetical protein